MPETLLNPDNRLLNWSINDLGLYGAALTPTTVLAAEQRQDYATRDDARSIATDGGAALVGSDSSNPAATPSSNVVDGTSDGSAATSAIAQPMMLPTSALSAPSISTLPIGAPAELGTGSTTGIFVPAPVPPPAASSVVSAGPVDTAHSLSAPVLPAGSAVDATTLSIPSVVAQTASIATEASSTVDVATATAATTAAALADTAQTLADTAASTTAALDDLTAPAVQAAEAAVDAAVTTASTVVAPVGAPLVDALAETGVADTPSALIDSTVTAPTDLLTGVGGTDPAGGVATLVDIVSAADEFDLSHVDAAPVADTGSIVDLLAVDLNDAPLLGVGDDGHDDSHDDAHGLFGL